MIRIVVTGGTFDKTYDEISGRLSFAEVLPPGVYIAMNGQHFPWDRVRKNRSTGVFELTEIAEGTGSHGATE